MSEITSIDYATEDRYLLAKTQNLLGAPEVGLSRQDNERLKGSMRAEGRVIEVSEISSTSEYGNSRTTVLGLGMLNAFTGFYSLYHWTNRLNLAVQRADFESKIESFLRLLGAPLAISNAIESGIIFLSSMIKGIAVLGISLSSAVIGSIFLLLEVGLEIYRLYTILKFKKDLNHTEVKDLYKSLMLLEDVDIKTQLLEIKNRVSAQEVIFRAMSSDATFDRLQTSLSQLDLSIKSGEFSDIRRHLQYFRSYIVQKKIKQIHQEYFELSPKEEKVVSAKMEIACKKSPGRSPHYVRNYYRDEVMKGKSDKLARRIGVKMAKKIKNINLLSINFSRQDTKVSLGVLEKRSLYLFNEIYDKTNKSLIVHAIGLAALLAGAALLLLSFFHAPEVLVVSIGVAVLGFQTGRLLAPKSFIDQDDYSFSLKPWISQIKKRFSTKKRKYECIHLETFRAPYVSESQVELKTIIDGKNKDSV